MINRKFKTLAAVSAIALAVLAKEAGIPDGVFNVVNGDAQTIGEEFCCNKIIIVLKIAFCLFVNFILSSFLFA